MNGLNIQEIANARIAELHESGSIQKQIEDEDYDLYFDYEF